MKIIKKICLSAVWCFSLAACSKDDSPPDPEDPADYVVETVWRNTSGILSSMRGIALQEINDEVVAVIVVDQSRNALFRIPVDGTLAALFTLLPKENGQNLEAWYITNAGPFFYLSTFRNGILKISASGGEISEFCGYANIGATHIDGPAVSSRFSDPRGLCTDIGAVYICDKGAHCISSALNSTGSSVLHSGNPAAAPSTKDEKRNLALFSRPTAICTNGNGNFFVAQEFAVRKITETDVTTLAGPLMGFQDGKGPQAAFDNITGICADKSGNVYVADMQNCCIRKIAPDGTTTTFAGKGDTCGDADGPAADARFDFPFDIAIASNGDFYVADMNNMSIRRIRKK